MIEEILGVLKDEDLVPMIHDLIEQCKPAVYSIISELADTWKDLENSDFYSLYNLSASGSKKMFDAYINVGFTEEQAMMLLLNRNLELIRSMNKISTNTNKRN